MNEELTNIHKLAVKRFERIQEKERDQRKLSVEDRKFVDVEDGQWDDDATEKRKNRPRYTVDRISPIIDQVEGDQRQNRSTGKVTPLKDGATPEVAKLYQGIIRSIEGQSNAENIYDNAFDEKLKGGYGGWRIVTEYNDDDIFVQDIKLKPILSADTSLFFGPSKEFDKSDAPYAFLISTTNKDDFVADNPGASTVGFDSDIYDDVSCRDWFDGDDMRIAEYWVKEPVTKHLGLLDDGRVIDLDEEKAVLDELKAQGHEVVRERKVKSHKVVMYKMNGGGIYGDKQEFSSKYIPLIPDYGKVSHIENKSHVRGMVRKGKDANRIYNYTTSANIETVALTPKDPYWYTPSQVEGYKDKYENFAVSNDPMMPYNNDPENPGPPRRTGAPSVQTALIEQTRQAALDVDASLGFFGPAKGDAPQLLSEKSVIAQSEKGDRGVFLYQDNHLKAIQYTYQILIDMIPRIYDTQRIVRILGEDGTVEMVEVNQKALDELNQPVIDQETGEQVIVNDLSVGKYEVKAESGPAFSTRRQETTQQLIDLSNASETFAELTPDLIAKNIDILESEEMHKRVRLKMIKAGLVEPTEEEIKEHNLGQPQKLSESEQALKDNVDMQTVELQSKIELNDEKAAGQKMQNVAIAVKAYRELAEAMKMQKESGVDFGVTEEQLMSAQEGIIQIVQDASV